MFGRRPKPKYLSALDPRWKARQEGWGRNQSYGDEREWLATASPDAVKEAIFDDTRQRTWEREVYPAVNRALEAREEARLKDLPAERAPDSPANHIERQLRGES